MLSSRTLRRVCRPSLRRHAVISSSSRRLVHGHAATGHEKLIPDYMTPLPAHQLTTLLTDLLPGTATQPPSSPVISDPNPLPLPPGAHLVYFPPLVPASELARDGAEADHVPRDFHLATPEEGDPHLRAGRRLWAGGQLSFREGWQSRMRLDARPWICSETVGRVDSRDDGRKTFVDVVRHYGRDINDWDITETRTLIFIREDEDGRVPAEPRIVKSSHTFVASPTHLFHFSALTYNAHFIHLDRANSLVHGPLLLAMMLRTLHHHCGPDVRSLSYRNIAPLRVLQQGRVCVREPAAQASGKGMWDVWVEGPQGGLVARGRADMGY